MKKGSIWGAFIISIALVLAIVGYIIMFTRAMRLGFNFVEIFVLCVITFTLAIAIIIGAVLSGREL